MDYRIYDTLPPEAVLIRREVFVEEQGYTEAEEFDDIDGRSTHLVLFQQGEPAATCRVFPGQTPGSYIFGRLAVRKPCRGRHLGGAILQAAEEAIRARGGREIRLHAQCHAQPFYEKYGYIQQTQVDHEEHIPHIWMAKTLRG